MTTPLPPDDALEPELRALFDAASRHDEMPASAPGNILAKVSAGLMLAPVITATATSATGGAAKATAWHALRKTATWIAFAAGAVSGAGGYAAVEHARSARQAPAPIAAPLPAAPSPPDAPEPAPTVSVPALNVPAAPPSASAPASPLAAPSTAPAPSPRSEPSEDAELAAERAQLEVARTALARGQAAAALGVLHADAAARPHGRLAEERDSMTVQALAMAGRTDEARARATTFARRYPRSLFLPIVQAAVAGAR